MLNWLNANLATILVLAVLLTIVGAVIVHLLRQKRSGKSSCGCDCSQCALKNKCH